MFTLNKHHREALLNELEKAKADLLLQNRCSKEEEKKDKQSTLIHWFDLSSFLAQERVKLIEKSLIDNEIDY